MSSLYDADFNRWTLEQTAALRAGRFQDLDLENLAEEIEGLSKNDKRAIKSQLVRLLFHLLKLRFPRSAIGQLAQPGPGCPIRHRQHY